MGKRIAPAIILEAIVLAVAFVFSTSYFSLGLYQRGNVHTVLLVMVWVLVGAVLLFILWARTLKREEMVRRFYLNKDYIYNHEIGYAPVSAIAPDGDEYELVTFAADSLARMSYGFEVADTPRDFVPDYLVSTSVFTFHEPYVEEGEDADDQGDSPVVIDRWEGTLQHAAGEGEFAAIGSFENARELARLLQDRGALHPAPAGNAGEGEPGKRETTEAATGTAIGE